MAESFSINFIFNKWDGNTITKIIEPFSKYSEVKRFSPFGTYDENISWKENSQATLTFKILRTVNSTINPFFQFITNGRELQLEYRNKFYEFVITSIVPKFYNENLEYEVSCQDSFSYFLAKNNVEANYADDKDATVLKWTGKTIGELASSILDQSGYKNKWVIDPNLGKTTGIPNFPAIIYGFNTRKENIATLELEGSNTLNGLIELATLFNARIEVIYPKNPNEQRTIYFRNKNVAHNSYIVLDKNVNLNDLGLSNTSEEFCTVLHVSGGTDANENIVSLVKPMPAETKLAIQQEINEALKENKTITFFNDLYEPDLFYDNKWEQDINNDYFPTLVIEGKEYKNIRYNKNEQNVIHDGYNINYTNYTENSKHFVVIKSITKGEKEISIYVYPLLNENYKPISAYAKNDKYDPGYGSMCKQVPCLSSILFDFSYLEETYQLPQEAHKEIKRILCRDYFNSNLQIQLYADSYYNLLRLYNQQIQQEEEAVFKISQAYNALMKLDFEDSLNTKVSIMYSALNNVIQNKIDIEDENQFISLTNEDYYTSIIYDAYQSLWSLWENNSSENNYLETQFNYFAGNNNNTFIEERKQKYCELAKEYQKELEDCLIKIEDLLDPYYNNEESKPEYIGTLNNLNYPLVKIKQKIESNNILYYIQIDKNYFKNLIEFENQLKNYDSTYVSYSIYKKRIEELFFYLGVYVVDSDIYYDGYCTCYYRAMKVLQDYCNTYTSNPEKGVEMNDISLGDNNNILKINGSNETITVNYETAEWLSHLTTNYHNSKNNCIDWLTFYNNATTKQKEIWNSLMERFGDFIIEGTYTDDTQLDSLGLYTAAATQFENMKRPQFNYSLKTIDWDLLKTDFYDFPEVGDIIAIKHIDLSLFQRSKTTKNITVRCELPKEGMRFQIGFFEKDGVRYKSIGTPFQQNGKWYLDFNFTYSKGSNIPSSFNFINRIYWNSDDYTHVLNRFIVKDERNIENTITEISQNLREKTFSISLSNQQAVEKIVKKLLHSIRYY